MTLKERQESSSKDQPVGKVVRWSKGRLVFLGPPDCQGTPLPWAVLPGTRETTRSGLSSVLRPTAVGAVRCRATKHCQLGFTWSLGRFGQSENTVLAKAVSDEPRRRSGSEANESQNGDSHGEKLVSDLRGQALSLSSSVPWCG